MHYSIHWDKETRKVMFNYQMQRIGGTLTSVFNLRKIKLPINFFNGSIYNFFNWQKNSIGRDSEDNYHQSQCLSCDPFYCIFEQVTLFPINLPYHL
jgi:hypothetical protein